MNKNTDTMKRLTENDVNPVNACMLIINRRLICKIESKHENDI